MAPGVVLDLLTGQDSGSSLSTSSLAASHFCSRSLLVKIMCELDALCAGIVTNNDIKVPITIAST
jgi:hypothetical protein